ncbi:MAG: VOC family protein [Gemmatimonadota bacterium]|jgi:predicted enzyme related to lactoylglutathione lyase/catechol 2,3-dioxygenase-like lactoylglutathione lyase family enzyme
MSATPNAPDLQALNAFYYYADVDAAWAFYRDVLGFETVADYGFAKIMRVAGDSYVTLVDAERGMHSIDEPKAVTLAVVTEQVEAWYDYLVGLDVPMRAELGEVDPTRAHNGFVAVDPEGYLLEFERFNPHDENADLLPVLDRATAVRGRPGTRPEGLDVQGTVLWIYTDALEPSMAFYERLLGTPLLVDQGWAKVYQASSTGFVGLVDGSRGLHRAVDRAAVTVSFFTSDVEAWHDRVREQGVPLRSEEIGDESGRVRTFVAFDPAGYFLEWDTFLDVEGNERLLEYLGG